MNIFGKVTLQSLLRNRTRTIVTVIGVILSVAMITSITTFISSLQHYMLSAALEDAGEWHTEAYNVGEDFVKELSSDKRVKQVLVTKHEGFARMPWGTRNDDSYLAVMAHDEAAQDILSRKLITGRLPQNSGEIALEGIVAADGTLDTRMPYAVGDTITLDIGSRYNNGERLGIGQMYDEDEGDTLTFEHEATKTYTVVGFIKRPYYINTRLPYMAAVTALDSYDGFLNAHVALKRPADVYAFADEYFKSYNYVYNNMLLMALGISDSAGFNTAIYSFGSILIVLVMFGSVALIYNAFAISVSERTREFGILSSVGATKHQLNVSVIYEAVFIGLIGVPLGIIAGVAGIGATLLILSSTINTLLNLGQFTLWVSWQAVAVAAAVSVVMLLISAYLPARRASRQSAIEAIRQTADVKLKAKSVKSPKLVQAIFGLEGTLALKNFKRNKRRYRSTVVSLCVSMMLFIAAYTFSHMLIQQANAEIDDYALDLYYFGSNEKYDDIALYDALSKADGVTGSCYQATVNLSAILPTEGIDKAYEKYMSKHEQSLTPTIVTALDDASFNAYAAQLGLDPDDFYDADNPKAIAVADYIVVENTQKTLFKVLGNNTPHEVILTDESGSNTQSAVTVAHVTEQSPSSAIYTNMGLNLFVPMSVRDIVIGALPVEYKRLSFAFTSDDSDKTYESMSDTLISMGLGTGALYNVSEMFRVNRRMLLIMNVFVYGFIVLISLICIANVFNTISTNIRLRRREFAMLRSVGMTDGGFDSMMRFECIIYGAKALLYGLPLSLAVSYAIYYITSNNNVMMAYDIPWLGVAVSVTSVFAVVFITMTYAVRTIRRENIIEALKID